MATPRGHKQPGRGADEAIWALVGRQHGVVSRAQLLRIGLTPSAITHRIRRGMLHSLHRGVFVVGSIDLDQLGRWLAAVLACGPEALLSHGTAAALWCLLPRQSTPIEVSVPV